MKPGSLTRGISGTSQFLDGMAAALRGAYVSGPIEPIAGLIPYPNIGLAYAIQETNTRLWLEGGRQLIGRKVNWTSAADQARMSIGEPIYGMLYDDMRIPPNGLAGVTLIEPRLTACIALKVCEDIRLRPANEAELIAHGWQVSLALELADSRIARWDLAAMDAVADNASAGAFMLGEAFIDLAAATDVHCLLSIRENGVEVGQKMPSLSFAEAVTASLWVARKMVQIGRPLLAGSVVLVAMDGPTLPVRSGHHYSADGGALGLVGVTIGG
jgi:2-keto-4-pentenoate hydratase